MGIEDYNLMFIRKKIKKIISEISFYTSLKN